MKNGVGRHIPKELNPFVNSSDFLNHERRLIDKKKKQSKTVFLNSYKEAFDFCQIKDKDCLSFHHHLRNGDKVLQSVCEAVRNRGLKALHFAPSSIFPSYVGMIDLIKHNQITNIHTNYINGPVARMVSEGHLSGRLVMNTHGGRARAIESGDLKIDVAFLACPTVDKSGNGSGAIGPNACGTLGYAIPDLEYAKKVILVTDHLVDKLEDYQFDGEYVDGVLLVNSIGDAKGIVSGTTEITRDPVGLKIAKDCSVLIKELGLIKDGFSMQTGAGKTSLAVVNDVKQIMKKSSIHGSFASGGITKAYVDMLEECLFEHLYDVQCFDLDAVKSFAKNPNHHAMSSSKYGNPFEQDIIAESLDFVVLGATEIDLNFNVNVTTDSMGYLMGGSGGHSDIAKGADVTIIISPMVKSRIPMIKENVMTVTTPGEDVDIFITERGIAINPKRQDLIDKLKNSNIKIFTMEELLKKTYDMIGVPMSVKTSDQIIGHVVYRDGTVIDLLKKVHDDYIR
ncbi:MAG TPA: citrate lyase subunit alpha [Candidatus Izemoplasmatales bacterium]|nr:citrate lyase subunit alpha [Candidatus Izemoplasmatales bacterium]